MKRTVLLGGEGGADFSIRTDPGPVRSSGLRAPTSSTLRGQNNALVILFTVLFGEDRHLFLCFKAFQFD